MWIFSFHFGGASPLFLVCPLLIPRRWEEGKRKSRAVLSVQVAIVIIGLRILLKFHNWSNQMSTYDHLD